MKSTIISCLIISLAGYVQGQTSSGNTYHLLVGTYTSPGKSDGIYVYTFNSKTGKFHYKTEATGIKNPSFLAVSKDRQHVYAVSEVGGGEGSVSAYAFNAATGALTYLNKASSGGNGPCHITVDDQKKYVFTGNYGSGSLAAIPVNADGSLGKNIQSIQHYGSSIRSNQSRPHVHATVLSPDNRYLLVPDLGTDKINIYQVDRSNSEPLSPADPAFASIEPGSGPRHFTFHPNKKFAYVIQEMTGMVTFFDYKNGKLKAMQTVTPVPSDFSGKIDAADIHISPDGNFLYGSLRGDIDELIIYSIGKKGQLTYVGSQSTLGKSPRNFAIDPTGNFLLVGNHRNDEIIIFKRSLKTGLLTPTGKSISIGSPVCLKFVAIN